MKTATDGATITNGMNTTEINRVLNGVPGYVGAFPSDARVTAKKLPASFIFNTDDSKGKGQHWVALYIDANGHGDYFDPYGIPPINENLYSIIDSLCKSWEYNKCLIQSLSLNSNACGQHCIIFIASRNAGFTMPQICNLFTSNRLKNDQFSKHIVHSVKNIFNK